ncbi:MAG TPA: response regulator transcription factor [Chryseolinea sp.]|nr:response regulator transcription factor [Chryseolinea sp.]
MKLLIIEDEKKLSGSIARYLAKEKFRCEIAHTVSEAEEKLALCDYDCVVLDISLPDGSGLTVLEEMRKRSRMDGVIILSARNSLDDRVKGLDLGADDYLVKPFHLPELRSRIGAIIRRRVFNGQNNLTFHELTIDPSAKTIHVSGNLIEATRKEFDLLLFLAANRNRVVSRRSIGEHIAGDQSQISFSYDFVYTHIKNIKKKLADAGCGDYIKTVHGIGYKLEA